MGSLWGDLIKKVSPVQMIQVLGACLEISDGNGNVRVITSTTGVPHHHIVSPIHCAESVILICFQGSIRGIRCSDEHRCTVNLAHPGGCGVLWCRQMGYFRRPHTVRSIIGDEFTTVDSRPTHGYDCTIETTTKPSSPVIIRDVSNRVGIVDGRGGGSQR